MLQDILKDFEERFPIRIYGPCGFPKYEFTIPEDLPLKLKDFITTTYNTAIKEGYESCLREVKARVESLKKYTPQGGNMPDTYFSEGHNECLDEIKSLINEI